MISHEHGVLSGSHYYVYTPSLQATKTFFYPLFLGHFFYSSDYYLERNSFDSYLFMYIKKGQCFVCQDSKTYTVIENQAILLDCYKPHCYYTTTGWEALWLHFDGPLAREFYHLITTSIGGVLTSMDTYRLEDTLQKIYSMFHDKTIIKEVLLNKYITDLLTQALISKDIDLNHTNTTDVIEQTTTYINEHLREDITVDFLATKASLSPYYFIKLFKKQIGLTPHDYLITARINHAKFLLKTTFLSIKEICFQCGFSNESSFCSTFKKRENMTPSAYREVKK